MRGVGHRCGNVCWEVSVYGGLKKSLCRCTNLLICEGVFWEGATVDPTTEIHIHICLPLKPSQSSRGFHQCYEKKSFKCLI